MIDILKEDGDLSRLECSTRFKRFVKRLAHSKAKERQTEISLEDIHIQPLYFSSAGLSNGSSTKDVYQIPYLRFFSSKVVRNIPQKDHCFGSTQGAEAVLTSLALKNLGLHLLKVVANGYK